MKSLFNRALNFAVLPMKLDITEVLVDFGKFSRAAIWTEFWHGREPEEEYVKPIFKTHKNNLPKNYSTPAGLKTYLSSIKSEIMDHKNRNQEKCNLPQSEIVALKELVRLQRERVITVKACDKGAGIIILDFKEYMMACYNHLLENQPNHVEENPNTYYKKRDDFALERAKRHIQKNIKRSTRRKYINLGRI